MHIYVCVCLPHLGSWKQGLFTAELRTGISICSSELEKSGFKHEPLKTTVVLCSIHLISQDNGGKGYFVMLFFSNLDDKRIIMKRTVVPQARSDTICFCVLFCKLLSRTAMNAFSFLSQHDCLMWVQQVPLPSELPCSSCGCVCVY